MKKSQRKTNGELFFWPLVIGVASCVGLISALVADGGWDAVSWGLLGIPIAVAAFYAWRKS